MNDDNDFGQQIRNLLNSDDPKKVAHAHALQALNDTEQSEDSFRQRCTLVPLVEDDEGWALADPESKALVMNQLLTSEDISEDQRQENFHNLFEYVGDTFSSSKQSLVPVLSMHAAKWVIFYRKAAFDRHKPGQSTAFGASDLQDALRILTHEEAKGDPAIYYFNHLKKG